MARVPVVNVAHANYQQIADRLRDQISVGQLGPGARLPSEPDLARDYDASRNTVRLAIALLTNQGLVVTRQGLGTFVREPAKLFTALLSGAADSPRSHHADTGLPVVGPQADEPETSRLQVETAPASPSVAAKLHVSEGESVVIRRSRRHIGGIPWLLIASFFPMDLARGTALEQAGNIDQGSIKLLAEHGHQQVGFMDEIGARMPDASEFGFFGLTTGTPVIVVNRTAYSEDRPIRLTRYIYRADRVRLAHEVGSIPAKYRSG
jgi:GntR family transcriptional regulator